ncbi:WhiB family transcriptional regulator [Bifidobacterium sp. SO1]|nr:WhiB family transcriptional regulator [Bifidobacterium sp. SO1]
MQGRDWHEKAKCLNADPDMFYPMPNDWKTIVEAKLICASCPVSAECLEQALDGGEQYGIWGGLDPEERRTLLRRKRQRMRME